MAEELRILMLEPDADDAASVEAELTRAGISFVCRRVETEIEFVSQLSDFQPDLVLSEYWLPEFDGMSALAITQEESPSTPFVFVSSAMVEELAVEAMQHGASDYVLKVALSRLGPALKRALRESRGRNELARARALLAEGEDRLRTILDSFPSGLIIIEPASHTVVDVNPAALQLLGLSRKKVVGRQCFELVCPARKGECPVTDLGHEMDRCETYLHSSSGKTLTVLKSVERIVLEGRTHLLESFVDVTRSRHMQEALRDSEETARTLLNVPIGAAIMIDTRGRLVAINKTGAEMLGREAEEMLGSDVFECFDAATAESRRGRVREVIRTRQPLRYEDFVDGRFFDNYLHPLFDALGHVNRVVLFLQDITERKKVEEAQKKDRDFIGKVLNTAGALVVVRERQGRVVLFNRKSEEVTGYRLEEVAGKRTWDLFTDPRDARRSRELFGLVLDGRELKHYEERWVTRKGDARLLSLSSASLLGAEGHVEYVITTGIDITESRRAEKLLKESEERYRTVFESTGTAMCIVDIDGILMFLNQEFAGMVGYAREEMLGNASFSDFLTAESAEGFKECQAELGRADREGPIHFECNLKSRDGRVSNMLGNMGFMPGLDSVVISLIDITREKEYEKELEERAERLRDFLVVASHELRHPITIVKGYASILDMYMEEMSGEQVRDILNDVTMSTDRLTRYVEQLLDISRIEQGRIVIERQKVSAGGLVGTAVEEMKVSGSANEFAVRVDQGLDDVEVDPEKFIQLLNILLDNAAKFSPPGTVIEADAERDGDIMVVSVLDRGEGIPEEDREKVFDRFYQVEEAAHHSKVGLGLGLYIAKTIARAHGGDVWVEPRKGGGSIFRFAVSVAGEESEKAEA